MFCIRSRMWWIWVAGLACAGPSATPHKPRPTDSSAVAAGAAHGPSDSAFDAMRGRGLMAMGVDQTTSTHHFTPLPDGGLVQLERDVDDSAGVAQIQQHLRGIARAFASGDFSTPMFVHMLDVPGTAVMAAKRAVITYSVTDLPRGGALRIVTHDRDAIQAIHEFLAFQRSDHRASE
jgi:hypothetical protein